MDQLTFHHTLGEGSYSTVFYATAKPDNPFNSTHFAVKVIDKIHIVRHNKAKYAGIEKNSLLALSDHPCIVKLYATFQDKSSLYFLLEYCAKDTLLSHLIPLQTLCPFKSIPIIYAQLVDAVEFIHSKNIIHRDLKPENVLVTQDLQLRVSDFGSAKILNPDAASSDVASFVGTAEYTSPELLNSRRTCPKSDIWALGCILFQLTFGRTPFRSKSEYWTFKKITNGNILFPEIDPTLLSPESIQSVTNVTCDIQNLVMYCLKADADERYDCTQIRSHRYLEQVAWDSIRSAYFIFEKGHSYIFDELADEAFIQENLSKIKLDSKDESESDEESIISQEIPPSPPKLSTSHDRLTPDGEKKMGLLSKLKGLF